MGSGAVLLVLLAGPVAPGSGRVRLSGVLAEQAGRLVADRLGVSSGAVSAFDPSSLPVRERWRTAVDVRHAVAAVTAGVSHALGVDLAQSPLPRHELVGDRAVPPGRRNYLAPADVRELPLGCWVEAGPYSRSEWLARGVAGAAGTAGFLRLNARSYLAVYETRGGAMWRLETTGRRAHHGLVHEGTAATVAAARDDGRRAVAERFPDAARMVGPERIGRVLSPALGWRPMVDGRDDRTLQRVFDERVSAVVAPRPGGRWETWVNVDGTLRQGPLTAGQAEAKDVADLMAARELAAHSLLPPDQADRLVADLAAHPEIWDREILTVALGHRLTEADRGDLATSPDPVRLAETMAATDVLAPETILRVLRAEGVDAPAAVGLVPALGVPVADAIQMLHDEWGLDRLQVAAALDATVDELRAAGCTPVELLAAAPREVLRGLDARESTWMTVGPSLLEAGYSEAQAVAHLGCQCTNIRNVRCRRRCHDR